MDRAAGRRLFTDGVERTVYEDNAGRQYVLGPDGEHVDGQWLAPADEPAGGGRTEEPTERTPARPAWGTGPGTRRSAAGDASWRHGASPGATTLPWEAW